jgi:predicted GNAT family acetyltransferase
MDIQHDTAAYRFVAVDDGQEVATLSYAEDGGTLDFQSVFVRPDQRGKGLAEIITKAAFEHARGAGKLVVPTCPYISGTFLRRHEQYLALTTAAH